MKITLATHYGMCFGVRDALRATHELAATKELTVLGQLVHNPVVTDHLESLGVRQGDLAKPENTRTPDVVITAHGASNRDRMKLARAGLAVADTTCPLVRKAHDALARLVEEGYFPVVIGRRDHVEVRGLTGDFENASVVLSDEDIAELPAREKFGVISQTTQPLQKVIALVEAIQTRHPLSQVLFVDTVCQPTKDRQSSVEQLARENDLVIVVGGHNSNNTRQLASSAKKYGARVYHVATPGELNDEWFHGVETVGITAGTSTLDGTVIAVRDRIQQIAGNSPT